MGGTMNSILVIDDEKTVLDMVKQILIKFGYDVETAESGQEGLDKFEQGSYDLVITDILMPEFDGNYVARQIRDSAKKDTPIIGISATPWLPDKEHFTRILSKPFPVESLVENVKSCIQITE